MAEWVSECLENSLRLTSKLFKQFNTQLLQPAFESWLSAHLQYPGKTCSREFDVLRIRAKETWTQNGCCCYRTWKESSSHKKSCHDRFIARLHDFLPTLRLSKTSWLFLAKTKNTTTSSNCSEQIPKTIFAGHTERKCPAPGHKWLWLLCRNLHQNPRSDSGLNPICLKLMKH